MTPAAPSRKKSPAPRPGKAAAETIRVAKCIVPLPAPKPSVKGAIDHEEDLAPGLPCEGRCGHCHHHPCRLHGAV
ncbi:MAG TPA: hypothetical protein VJ528_03530 [Geothrix sp.]|uniref:hypothetical protein n=1 Tax=Geothrix mesophila TaxID=2922723 RepID=UPI001FAC0D21|nr:hypothetical protein [Geothrix sp. SG198]HJV37887.1 hypothetical protein [Geothrix sp.]